MCEADFLPRISNLDFYILEDKQQVDELLSKGFELPPDLTVAEKRIAKGAKGFCFFVNRKLAHIGWVAMSEEAKSTIDPVPFKIDYANHEACMGGSITIPKYQGQGLMTYCLYKRLKYLFDKGILITRNRIIKGNIPSEKVHAKFRGRIYAELKYRKIMCFETVKVSHLQSPIKLGN